MEAAISEGDDGWRGAREASSSHAASPRLREVVAESGGRGSIRSLFIYFLLYSYFRLLHLCIVLYMSFYLFIYQFYSLLVLVRKYLV